MPVSQEVALTKGSAQTLLDSKIGDPVEVKLGRMGSSTNLQTRYVHLTFATRHSVPNL